MAISIIMGLSPSVFLVDLTMLWKISLHRKVGLRQPDFGGLPSRLGQGLSGVTRKVLSNSKHTSLPLRTREGTEKDAYFGKNK